MEEEAEGGANETARMDCCGYLIWSTKRNGDSVSADADADADAVAPSPVAVAAEAAVDECSVGGVRRASVEMAVAVLRVW